MQTKGVVIAGLAGGSGKSVVSVGLTAFLASQNLNVVPFKKGPDYIDAGWMALAAGKNCYNLDPYLMSEDAIQASIAKYSRGADVVIIEGNRGLYDGVNASGGFSTAELAISLRLPVLLVVNCTKTTRTVAAMVLGCKLLDPRLDIQGVILNHIATARQKNIITEAVEKATGLPVLGVVPRMKKDIFPMRHLGMVPHQEYRGSDDAVSELASMIGESLDITGIERVMRSVKGVSQQASHHVDGRKNGDIRIGVIQDAAFQFYYSENLEALELAGATIVPVNALKDRGLPQIDGLYIGGGFPETSAGNLAANKAFRDAVRNAAGEGLPIYAECGGLIYLGESIVLDGNEYALAGVFPVRFGMSDKPQAHGYTVFKVDKQTPFYTAGSVVKGHEFRYSTILEWRGSDRELAVKMQRGKGFINGRDGLVRNNVMALYTHIHAAGTPRWAPDFVRLCKANKNQRMVSGSC